GLARLTRGPLHVRFAERLVDGVLVHLDGALELRAFLDADLWRRYVAAHLRVDVHVDPLRCVQVAFRRAVDGDGARVDIGPNLSFSAYRQVAVLELHRAADVTFNAKIFIAADVAIDLDRSPDHRAFAVLAWLRGCRSLAALRRGRREIRALSWAFISLTAFKHINSLHLVFEQEG